MKLILYSVARVDDQNEVMYEIRHGSMIECGLVCSDASPCGYVRCLFGGICDG